MSEFIKDMFHFLKVNHQTQPVDAKTLSFEDRLIHTINDLPTAEKRKFQLTCLLTRTCSDINCEDSFSEKEEVTKVVLDYNVGEEVKEECQVSDCNGGTVALKTVSISPSDIIIKVCDDTEFKTRLDFKDSTFNATALLSETDGLDTKITEKWTFKGFIIYQKLQT